MKFVLRFDDIAPSMAWSKFACFDKLSNALDLPFLVGVVPDCLDSKLAVEPERANFWDVVREWNYRGWTIAQHGYTHQYVTQDPGLLVVNNKSKQSEFAGLSYEKQFTKLKAGKDILIAQGVWQPVFMAPSHSFDENTLQALTNLEFRYLTDGYGVYPYRMNDLTAVPQLFASPLHFGFGVYTICLHVNNMSDFQIFQMVEHVKKNRQNFISFNEAARMISPIPGVAVISRFVTSAALRMIRALRNYAVDLSTGHKF